jgi:hypothetical protein
MLKYDANGGFAKISCDGCRSSLDSIMNSDKRAAMDQAVRLAKLGRWQLERHAGAWQHFCPTCRQDRHKGKLL